MPRLTMGTSCAEPAKIPEHKALCNPHFMHTHRAVTMTRVFKPAVYTRRYAQRITFLYTLFTQVFGQFSSVIDRFVHTIHRVYKYNYYLYINTL